MITGRLRLLLLATWAVAGCGGAVEGTAHVLSGASATPAAALRLGTFGRALAEDGHWFLSPDQALITVTRLGFLRSDGSSATAELTGCAPGFQAASAALTSVLDCPFSIPAGTYVGLDVTVDTTAVVGLSDAVNGIYTDPSSSTGLSLTEPTDGAVPVPMRVNANGNDGLTTELLFSKPLVVSEKSPPSVTLLGDMIHTVFADISGGIATFDTSLPLPPVSFIATSEPVDPAQASVEYYAPTATAGDVSIGPGGTGNESGSLRVFYTSPGQPAFVWHVVNGPSAAWAANPATSPTSGDFRTGGYLGLDANGTLCWALPTDFTYTSYARLCRMQVVANLGDTTTIECQSMSSVPAPTSGDTYASGCPSITPDSTTEVTLVAR